MGEYFKEREQIDFFLPCKNPKTRCKYAGAVAPPLMHLTVAIVLVIHAHKDEPIGDLCRGVIPDASHTPSLGAGVA